MSVLVEFSIVPMGTGDSLSPLIARAIRIVAESGLPYKVNPMGTVLEGEWDQVMGLVKSCHQEMRKNADRVITTIKIDDRAGESSRLEKKVEAVEQALKMKLNR